MFAFLDGERIGAGTVRERVLKIREVGVRNFDVLLKLNSKRTK